MDEYNNAVQKYYTTLKITGGCGSRAQTYIDNAHEEVVKAFNKLDAKDKENIEQYPKKSKACDDGNYGMTTGLSAYSQLYKK